METNFKSIKYEGKVKIKLEKYGVVYFETENHNEGKDALFNFIANCLSSNYNVNRAPSKIKLFNGDTELTRFIPIGENTISGGSVIFTTVIPYSSLTFEGTGSLSMIKIYNSAGEELAKTNLDEPIPQSSITSQSSTIVEWTMTVANASN